MSFSYFLELRKHNLNERKRQMALWLDKRLGFAAKMVLGISKLISLLTQTVGWIFRTGRPSVVRMTLNQAAINSGNEKTSKRIE